MKIIAKVLLKDSAGKILTLRRSGSHPRFAHHIDFPGGEVEGYDTSYTVAVAREIEEETGLIILPNTITEIARKDHGKELRHVICSATVHDANPKVTLSWEHDAYQWLSTEILLQQSLPENPDFYYCDVLEHLNMSC